MINMRMWHKFLLTFIFLFFLTGCNTLRPDLDPVLDNKALNFASRARAYNDHIITSKGIGWIRLKTNNGTDQFKIAWAAVFPNKLRITFLLSGHPVETIIATGKKVIFISHTGDHSLYTTNAKDPDLKNYIKVPVKLSELISVLLGRFPVKEFDDVYFSPKDSSLSTIILWKNWKGIAQYLNVDGRGNLNGIKKTNPDGQLLYDMSIIDYQTIAADSIPYKIQLKDAQNRIITLTITNFKANPILKESVFQLTAKGS